MRKKKSASYLANLQANVSEVTNVDEAKKEYLKVVNFQTKIRNGLLGNFSLDGKYKIDDENILKCLVSLEKKFGEKSDNVVYASAIVAGVVLNFKVEFEIDASYCKAKLFLIETEKDVEENIKHVTELASVLEPYSTLFKEEVFKLWHISVDAEQISKENPLFKMLEKQKNDFEFSKELTEILSQIYLLKMLKLLDSLGEVGKDIKQDYQATLSKILQSDASIMLDNTRMKQILDKMIAKHKAFDKVLALPEAAAVFAGYSVPLANVLMKEPVKKQVESVEVVQKDKKPESKSASPKKKASKAKGGDAVKPFVLDMSKLPKFSAGSSGTTLKKPEEKPKAQANEVKKEVGAPINQTEKTANNKSNEDFSVEFNSVKDQLKGLRKTLNKDISKDNLENLNKNVDNDLNVLFKSENIDTTKDSLDVISQTTSPILTEKEINK